MKTLLALTVAFMLSACTSHVVVKVDRNGEEVHTTVTVDKTFLK